VAILSKEEVKVLISLNPTECVEGPVFPILLDCAFIGILVHIVNIAIDREAVKGRMPISAWQMNKEEGL
jgi:hypothetical protein